jgi:hypothetical protein
MVDVSAIEEAWMRSHIAAWSANRRVLSNISGENSEKVEDKVRVEKHK